MTNIEFTSIHVVPKLNERTETVQRVIEQINQAAQTKNIPIVTEDQLDPYTLVIAVGGDGTMLEAMKRARRTGALVVGIHAGNMGFLTEFDAYPPLTVFQRIVNLLDIPVDDNLMLNQHPNYVVEHRFVLNVELPGGEMVVGMNEVSVAGMASDQLIRYHLGISPRGVSWLSDAGVHKANSIMVSTPTGSTAYSMSAGGSLMSPDLRAMQVVPVAPYTLTSRPIIISGHSVVQISAWGSPIAVRVDGVNHHTSELPHTEKNPCVISVRMNPNPVNVLHDRNWNYYSVLTNKLGWNVK